MKVFTGKYDRVLQRKVVQVDGRELPLPTLRPDELRHSPTGFEWGYGGSGPAELARAILLEVFPGEPLVRYAACYQRFKFDVIANLPRDGFRMTSDFVWGWYKVWLTTHPGTAAARNLQEQDRIQAELLEAQAEVQEILEANRLGQQHPASVDAKTAVGLFSMQAHLEDTNMRADVAQGRAVVEESTQEGQ